MTAVVPANVGPLCTGESILVARDLLSQHFQLESNGDNLHLGQRDTSEMRSETLTAEPAERIMEPGNPRGS